jgi:hypothetical protein
LLRLKIFKFEDMNAVATLVAFPLTYDLSRRLASERKALDGGLLIDFNSFRNL